MIRYATLLLLLATVGTLDYATGYELSFAVFYLIPVAGAGWLIGRGAGIAFAILSAATWMLVDHLGGHTYSHWLFYYWNGCNRLVIGAAAALSAAAIRKTLFEQKSLIIELRRALLTLNEVNAQVPYCPICHSFRDDDFYKSKFDQFIRSQTEPRALGTPCPACLATRAEHFRPDKLAESSRA